MDGELLQFLSPLGWEHINLTGDYVWRQSRRLEDGSFGPYGCPENLSVRFFPNSAGSLSHLRKAEREDGRERQAHEAGARTRATAHERTPQQERQKAAREAERGREAWTLGQGMKKPVAGCYGRLTRWKGGGDVVYMALL